MKFLYTPLLRGKKLILITLCFFAIGLNQQLFAQVTTSSITGVVTDENREPLIGANVIAIHTPSGSTYGTFTNLDGRFTIPSMRIGGPYTITTSYTGYEPRTLDNIFLSLGTPASFNIGLQVANIELGNVIVTSDRNDVFTSGRTGAANNITSQQLNSLPTINRNFIDFARLTPQASTASFGTSFGGQDNRMNNVTIDGSLLNNSFGLTGEPGGRTGISAISLDAIEEVQVNIAPFDVRQAGFVGAGINAVTRSGTNKLQGSVFYNLRNQNLAGTKAGEVTFNRDLNKFNVKQYGFRLGGPLIKNKLFFFVSVELERQANPYLDQSNLGNEEVTGNKTRVLKSDLDAVSGFLKDNFGYETGFYENYDLATTGDKYLAKLDWNLSDKHRFSIRFNRLDSQSDILTSNSSSLGFGNRRNNRDAMAFRNSNYIQFDKITSVIGELNSLFGSKMSNNFIAGYTYQFEDRGSRGTFFPLIEIQKEAKTYMTTGFEPFTPSNKLNYKTYQLQDNLSFYMNKHTITAGVNLERLEFVNVFFPGSQGVFVYNSLEDFYADLLDAKANPSRTTSPVSLRRFQFRYSALPGGAEPVQPTKVTYVGAYLQDEFAVSSNFNLTYGVRMDIPFFGETGYENPAVPFQTYRDPEGNPLTISTSKLPDAKPLFSPRVGFNYDVTGEKNFQIRGGTGIFTGLPPFVWISNQIGNNGVLTGFEQIDNTDTRPFTETPIQFITNAAAPSSYEINITDPDFKFPQVWRSNLAVDKKIFSDVVLTLEGIFSQDINGLSYWNINEEPAVGNFAGPDTRPRYPGAGLSGSMLNSAVRINDNVTGAYYLTNQNEGTALSLTASLEKKFSNGFFGKVAYNFGSAKNLVDAGSIASGSYNSIVQVNGANHPDLSYTNFDQRNRFLGAVTYRAEYFDFGATQIGLFIIGANQGRFSYTYNNDMNGDGISNNDLLFVPNNASDLTFQTNTVNSIVFSPEQQAAAYEAYINQDEYLSTRRGQYAERGGVLQPMIWRADFSISQEFFINTGTNKNTLQFRADILNFTNLINKDWGVANQIINARPLTISAVDANGVPSFKMQTTGSGTSTKLLSSTYQKSANIASDVYRIQLGIRYTFN